jgi:hypothetical protein
MVARGVRSRALRAHPFSALVRYDDHRQRNWFYRSLSPLGPSRRNDAGWACKVVPDERSALETEIARLQGENAMLKKDSIQNSCVRLESHDRTGRRIA